VKKAPTKRPRASEQETSGGGTLRADQATKSDRALSSAEIRDQFLQFFKDRGMSSSHRCR